MKLTHNITITEFVREGENLDSVKQALKELIPFDLKQEKILLKEEITTGVDERQTIKILTIFLQKENHTKKFLWFLMTKLSAEQKELLLKQKESRTDNNLYFFIRLEKDKWNLSREASITDGGNCVHIKILLAAFPAKKENALKIVDKIVC